MSKRARITLDPGLDETDASPATAPKAAAMEGVQAGSAPEATAAAEPRASRTGNAKARPKVGPGAQGKPRAKARTGSKASRKAVTGTGQEAPAVQAATPGGDPKAEGARPFVSAAPRSAAASGSHDDSAVVTPSSTPEAGMLNLGTVLKVAVVGVVVVAAVIWLKRRP